MRDSEFLSCEIELQNRVTQNYVTLGVTNSKIFYGNSSFKLLTGLCNSKLKNKKSNLELKTPNWKMKNLT